MKENTKEKTDWQKQYLGDWDTNAEFIRTCGECVNFGANGCKSSYLESKYGSRNTPACSEFELESLAK